MADKYIDVHLARKIFPTETFTPSKDASDFVTYVRKDVVKKVGDGEDDFIIEEKVVEDVRVNRQAYIAQHANEVGVLNILQKVRQSGDLSLLNQTGPAPEGLQDYTEVPGSVGAALKSVQKGANSFAALKAIFGDISFYELAQMSDEQIKEKLNAYVNSTQPVVEEKGENK